jgi:hypothetical protein
MFNFDWLRDDLAVYEERLNGEQISAERAIVYDTMAESLIETAEWLKEQSAIIRKNLIRRTREQMSRAAEEKAKGRENDG